MHETRRNWPSTCRVYGCRNPAVGGGHVNVYGDSSQVYIIPMCNVCNTPHNRSWMNVNAGTEAVIVEQDDTRGPQGTCYYR